MGTLCCEIEAFSVGGSVLSAHMAVLLVYDINCCKAISSFADLAPPSVRPMQDVPECQRAYDLCRLGSAMAAGVVNSGKPQVEAAWISLRVHLPNVQACR